MVYINIKTRKITEYISQNIRNFKLVDVTTGMHDKVKFYLYKKL